jgi:glucose-6-phosphate 1-dehydrogenase
MTIENQAEIDNEMIAFIIFGVTGDLTRRKLIPALYQLKLAGELPNTLDIIGFARRPWTKISMRENLQKGLQESIRSKPLDLSISQILLNTSDYVQSSFEEDDGYKRLHELLESKKYDGVIYYLATPPEEYLGIIEHLGAQGLHHQTGWARIVVEKPFGHDLNSAIELEESLHRYFSEDQIFRIDHYLGKETVQNILVFRFANGIFEPLWNNHYIDHVQILVAETIGIGTRAGYFEQAGIIRDMFANHLLQLVTLTAMEAPVAFNASSVRDEKMKVLRSLRSLKGKTALENSFRAQYATGTINGLPVLGYKQEQGISPQSITETFLAMKLNIDNWRWAGVPFYLRCGKRLPIYSTEIAIHFKQVPLSLFDWKNLVGEAPNILTLRIQPDEGISLSFGAKIPGHINQIAPVVMDFCYQDSFGNEPPEAYERLLLDCMLGDATLFTRMDEVMQQWKFTQEIMDSWIENPVKELPEYSSGTWGSTGIDQFIGRDDRRWSNPGSK